MTPSNSEQYRFGGVVLVKFPFTDLKRHKQRPALVLASIKFSQNSSLVIVAMITSRIESKALAGDVLLSDWQAANLLHPSIVRLCKVATLEDEIILGKLGILSTKSQKAVKASLQELLSL